MHIGILQPGHAPDQIQPQTGDFADMFQALLAGQGFTFTVYDVEAGEMPDAVQEADGWLITGSRHGAYEDHAFVPLLEDFIRAVFDADIPMVGVCFGHQIIAQAMGGRVEKFDGGWAVGRQTYDWQGAAIALNAWHQDQVVVRPKTAHCIAGNAFCENAALIYGRQAFTVQPHPEFGAEVVEGLIKYRGKGVVPEEQLNEAATSVGEPVASDILAEKIASFFRDRQI